MKRFDPNPSFLGNDGGDDAFSVSRETRTSGGSGSSPQLVQNTTPRRQPPHNSMMPFQGHNNTFHDHNARAAVNPAAVSGMNNLMSANFPNINDLLAAQTADYTLLLQQRMMPNNQQQMQQHLLQQHLQQQHWNEQHQGLLQRPLDSHPSFAYGYRVGTNAVNSEPGGMIPFMNQYAHLLQGQNLPQSHLPYLIKNSAVLSDPNFTQALGMGGPSFRRNFISSQDPSPMITSSNIAMMNPNRAAPGYNNPVKMDGNVQALLHMQQVHYQQLLLQQAQLVAAATAASAPQSMHHAPSSPPSHSAAAKASVVGDPASKRRKVHRDDLKKQDSMMHLGEVIKPRKKKKDKLRPKRPLSSYNLFFRAQRESILNSIPNPEKFVVQQTEDQTDSSIQEAVIRLDDDSDCLNDASNMELPTKNNPIKQETMTSMPDGAESLKKLPHRKIGFETLAKVIGQKWSELSNEDRLVYDDLAKEDMKRYKEEMEVYLDKKHMVKTLGAKDEIEVDYGRQEKSASLKDDE